MDNVNVGAITAKIQVDLGGYNSGMEKAKTKAKELGSAGKDASASFDKLGAAISAIGATAAMTGLVRTIKSLAGEAQTAAMAVKGLAEISKALGQDVEKTTGLVNKFVQEGLLGIADASNAVKTALSMDLNLAETEQLIRDLADSAAYNRVSYMSMSGAIVQGVQAIKQGNSELLDNSGIVENLSVMQTKYAKSIGTTADKLSEQQKVVAALNGVHQASALFVGNAQTALQGYAGTQVSFNQSIEVARKELGESFLPALEAVMKALTPLIISFGHWAAENKEAVAGIAAGTLSVTALTAVLSGLVVVIASVRTALQALNIALGPIGWAVTAISLAATGFMAYKVAADATADSVLKFANSQEELNAKLAQSPLKRSVEDLKNLQSDINTLNGIMEKRNKLMEQYNTLSRAAESGQGSVGNTQRLLEIADGIKEIDVSLRKMDYKNADEAAKALGRMRQAYEESIPARIQVEKSTISEIAQRVQQTAGIEKLRDKYEELSKAEKLNDAQKAELASTVKSLAQQYPDVIAQMDEEGRYIITNTELLDTQIKAEQIIVQQKAELRKLDLIDIQKTTKAKLEAAKAEITALKAVMEASTKKSAMDVSPTFDESKVSSLLTGAARDYAIAAGRKLNEEATRQIKEETEKATELQASLIELSRIMSSLDGGKWDDFLPKTDVGATLTGADKEKKGKTPEEIAAELRKKLFTADMATARYMADFYDQSADDQIAALEEIRSKHAQYLAENIDDERSIALQIKALNAEKVKDAEEAAKASYELSAHWIEMEERRLREKGATEKEIAEMQLNAWTRVLARYEEDTDEYKAVDKALYNARMMLIREAEKAAKDADETREKRRKDATKATLSALEAEKKAEIAVIETQKKARKEYYDAQIKALDSVERQRDRSEIQAEAEKYRLATSEQGQKRYAELIEQLRKMDVEDQKSALQDARDAETSALDKRKDDIESWYNDIKSSIETFGDDVSGIYQATEDARFQAFMTTNGRIKTEMERFKSEIAAITNVSTTTGSAYEVSIVRQMQANATAWHSSDAAGKQRLEAMSQQLGASIGATYSNGAWLRNGIPLFHSGGIAGMTQFNSGSTLLPDEIAAVLRKGEVTLTPAQVKAFTESVGNGKGGGGTTVHIEKMIEMNGNTFEDETDFSAFERNAGGELAEIIRKL